MKRIVLCILVAVAMWVPWVDGASGAPAISLSMQATQIHMFPGFPHFCKRGAEIPTKIPAETIPLRELKN